MLRFLFQFGIYLFIVNYCSRAAFENNNVGFLWLGGIIGFVVFVWLTPFYPYSSYKGKDSK